MTQADASLESDKPKIKTPAPYEMLKHTLSSGGVNGFDGFRMAVTKQINLHAASSHLYVSFNFFSLRCEPLIFSRQIVLFLLISYWIGSQTVPPMYQFSVFLGTDNGQAANVRTDAELNNVEAEFRTPITTNIAGKTNLVLTEQMNQVRKKLFLFITF